MQIKVVEKKRNKNQPLRPCLNLCNTAENSLGKFCCNKTITLRICFCVHFVQGLIQLPRNTSGANPEIRVDGKKLHAFFNRSGAKKLVVLVVVFCQFSAGVPSKASQTLSLLR